MKRLRPILRASGPRRSTTQAVLSPLSTNNSCVIISNAFAGPKFRPRPNCLPKSWLPRAKNTWKLFAFSRGMHCSAAAQWNDLGEPAFFLHGVSDVKDQLEGLVN